MSVKDGMASFGPMTYPFATYDEAMALVREGKTVPADLLAQLPPWASGAWTSRPSGTCANTTRSIRGSSSPISPAPS